MLSFKRRQILPKLLAVSPRPRPSSRKTLAIETLDDRIIPADILVTTTADSLDEPGAVSLRDAIRYVNGFNEQNNVTVPAGTYTLSRTGNEDAALTGDLDILSTGGTISIWGAGAGQTIIDAAGIDRVFDVHPGARLFIMNATIRGGLADNGGGFHARGQIGLANCVVTGNTARLRGGAVDVNELNIQMSAQNTLFENNFAGTSATSTGLGGAINNGGGMIQINDSVFRNNRTGTLGSGGAVYNQSGGFIAITSNFEQNRSGMGGAIATADGRLNIVESTLTGNKAEFSGATAAPMGGAVYGTGEIYIERSTLTLNEATGGGRGGAVANRGQMEVTNSTITGNKAGADVASGAGAGIYNSGPKLWLINSTVTQNKTLGGGWGDGVLNNALAANFSILNTIVAQNGFIPGNNGPDTYGNFTSWGGNLIGVQAGSGGWNSSDQVGTYFAPLDPRLGPLQNNGGPTATHALRLGSLAIDRGINHFYLANTGGVDQRNLKRVINNIPDVGAYELQPRSNGAPVGNPDAYEVNEDGLLTANSVLANDTDPDGDILDAELVAGVAHGQLTLNINGSFTYRPAANFHGTDSFTYRAFDGALRSELTTVTITINSVNDAPVANNNSYSTDEDTTLNVPVPGTTGILGNDTDADGDTLTAELVSGPSRGTLTLNENGSFTYTPGENFNGTDSFTYKAFDGAARSASAATVTLTVRAVNDAPIATQGLEFSTMEEQALNAKVTATDVDGDALTFTVDSAPTWGTLNLNSNGNFTYTPFVNFRSGDTFRFKVSDGQLSDTARVVITVQNVNDAPVAYGVNIYMDEDTFVTDRVFDAQDIDGDALRYTVLPNENPGEFTYSSTAGKFNYRPPADFNGTVVYYYKANDGQLDSNESTVTFHVSAVNDAPVAASGSASTDEDTALSGQVSAADVDGDSLTYSSVDQPDHGKLEFADDGIYTYTPNLNFNGTDSFTFRASDGNAESNVATISISVQPVNDAPVAASGSASTDEDTALTGQVTATDVDSSSLIYSAVDLPANGTLVFGDDGAYIYTPNLNYNGTDSFTFKASDGSLDSNVATIDITVRPINDAPVTRAGADAAIDEGGTASFDGRGSFDVDGDSLTYFWEFGDGATATGPTASHRYPESGEYTISLTVSDGAASSTDTLTLTVRNLAPVASVGGPTSAVPGQSVAFNFSASDPSPGDTAAGFTYQIAWGDGQTESASGSATGVTRSHIYTSTGNHTVSVTATDRNGGTSAPATRGIAVTAANLQNGTLFVGGTTSDDTIDIRPMNSSGGLAVKVNGLTVGNLTPTADITVYGLGGADNIVVASAKIGKTTYSVGRPIYLFGEDGSDTLSVAGAAAGAVVIGGAGADSLTGGSGDDLLIGGAGADTVRAGSGEDIVIGAGTDFDNDLAALRAIRSEWVRSDVTFATRVAHLRGSAGGLNGTRFLTATTIDEDAIRDTLYGEGGTDWFFAKTTGTSALTDLLQDDKNNETFTLL
jgi:VCBS repeat-containing protein